MSKWNDVEQDSLLTGKALSPEVKKVSDNVIFLKKAIALIRDVESMLGSNSRKLAEFIGDYEGAKDTLDREKLDMLNAEMEILKPIIDSNFETTLNGLAMKPEVTAERQKAYLQDQFKLPVTK